MKIVKHNLLTTYNCTNYKSTDLQLTNYTRNTSIKISHAPIIHFYSPTFKIIKKTIHTPKVQDTLKRLTPTKTILTSKLKPYWSRTKRESSRVHSAPRRRPLTHMSPKVHEISRHYPSCEKSLLLYSSADRKGRRRAAFSVTPTCHDQLIAVVNGSKRESENRRPQTARSPAGRWPQALRLLCDWLATCAISVSSTCCVKEHARRDVRARPPRDV